MTNNKFEAEETVRSPNFQCVKRTPHFEIVGCIFTHDGERILEVENRCRKAWNCFYKHFNAISFRGSPTKTTLDMIGATVLWALTWGTETRSFTTCELHKFSSTYRQIIANAFSMKRLYDKSETFVEYIQHTHRFAASMLKQMNKEEAGDYIALKNIRWAGHLARMGSEVPTRLAPRCTFYKCRWQWAQREIEKGTYSLTAEQKLIAGGYATKAENTNWARAVWTSGKILFGEIIQTWFRGGLKIGKRQLKTNRFEGRLKTLTWHGPDQLAHGTLNRKSKTKSPPINLSKIFGGNQQKQL